MPWSPHRCLIIHILRGNQTFPETTFPEHRVDPQPPRTAESGNQFYIFRWLTRAWFRLEGHSDSGSWYPTVKWVDCCPFWSLPVHRRRMLAPHVSGLLWTGEWLYCLRPKVHLSWCAFSSSDKSNPQENGKHLRTWQGHMILPNATICCSGTARARRSFSVFSNSMRFSFRKFFCPPWSYMAL